MNDWINKLYYGDNLSILREYVKDESVDLIYLDPPFNSKANYNILFKEPTGTPSKAQITAFEDTWHWSAETELTFTNIIEGAPAEVVEMMDSFRKFVGQKNDVMAYLTMMCIRLLELKRVLKNAGTIYLHCDPTASHYIKILMDTILGKKNFRNEIIWCYAGGGVPKKDFPRKHDIIFRYTKNDNYTFNTIYRPYSPGTIQRGRTKVKGKYAEIGLREEGTPINDWWTDVPKITSPTDPEKLGYPTQKSEALLERIIKVSSNEGDLVMDPFCGCGTAIVAAQRLKRKWIGIDITHLAINLIKGRLKDTFSLENKKDYRVIGEPEDLAGARELASQHRYQFQWWAISLFDGRPYGDKKKGSDTGIDGYLYFSDERDKIKRAIIQVKSGRVSVKDIRELSHVMDRENTELGIFITLEAPTKPMQKEAAIKGFYKSEVFNKNYAKIQILTIEELFSGKRPDTPPVTSPYKQANYNERCMELEF